MALNAQTALKKVYDEDINPIEQIDHALAHGYVEAKEVFRRIEEKYKNITPEQARELLRTGAYKRKPSD